jgi:hypothetical protein
MHRFRRAEYWAKPAAATFLRVSRGFGGYDKRCVGARSSQNPTLPPALARVIPEKTSINVGGIGSISGHIWLPSTVIWRAQYPEGNFAPSVNVNHCGAPVAQFFEFGAHNE